MTAMLHPETSRLASLVEKVTGNVVPEGQYPHLQKVFERQARAAGFSLIAYAAMLEKNENHTEWRNLLPEITIKESFLFRISEQFEALSNELLPNLVANRSLGQTLRFWSAGCARGEEPSTLAVVLAECPDLLQRSWKILATDVDEQALDDARRAEYGERAISRVPPHLLRRYFDRQGSNYVLCSELRDRIEYRPFNFFASAFNSLGPPFDVILLRNVLIYFNRKAQQKVVAQVVSRLAQDGYLFLGHSESLWQLNDRMVPVELKDCFAYRPGRPEELSSPGSLRESGYFRKLPSPMAAAAKADAQASGAPATSAQASGKGARPPITKTYPEPSGTKARPDYSGTVPRPDFSGKIQRPDFSGKIARPDFTSRQSGASEPPPPRPEPVEDQLTSAAVALAQDRLGDARELLQDCLPSHKTDAFAHALNGLICDLGGEAQEAVAAYRAALFLDPHLFQIRYLLAKRFAYLGLAGRARNEYRQVLATLENGRYHDLADRLPSIMPSRQEIANRCRRALSRP